MSFLLNRVVIFFISISFFAVLYVFVQNVSTRIDFFVMFFSFQNVSLLLVMFLSALFGFFLQIVLSIFWGLRKSGKKEEVSSSQNAN